jgi:hypothetical protein
MLVPTDRFLELSWCNMPKLNHKDSFTIVVVDSTGYGNKKVVQEQHDIRGTMLQNTGYLHTTNQDLLSADAILYPNERDPFVIAHHNRLEGMYVVVPLYGADNDESWYKITSVSVNRDHLLSNKIDNIQLALKRTEKLSGVS